MTAKEEVFGVDGWDAYNNAMKACHHFAKATGCPLGVDVVIWLNEKTFEYQEALNARANAR